MHDEQHYYKMRKNNVERLKRYYCLRTFSAKFKCIIAAIRDLTHVSSTLHNTNVTLGLKCRNLWLHKYQHLTTILYVTESSHKNRYVEDTSDF